MMSPFILPKNTAGINHQRNLIFKHQKLYFYKPMSFRLMSFIVVSDFRFHIFYITIILTSDI